MNNLEIAHLWAHKAKPSAKGSHFFFDGDTIYSYGHHFPIARHVKNAQGVEAILFTRRTYSVSTSKHIGYVRGAIPQSVRRFYVQNPRDEIRGATLLEFTKRAVELVAESRKPRKRAATVAGLIGSAQGQLQAAKELADFFGLDYTPPTDVLKLADEWQAQIEAERIKSERRAKRAQKQAIAEAQEKIKAFQGGEAVQVPYAVPWAFARIASNPADETVAPQLETSKGAYVHLAHVKRALPIVCGIIETGKGWQANGHTIKLGHYQIDEITPEGTLIAGCHRFQKEEVLRIAKIVAEFYAKA